MKFLVKKEKNNVIGFCYGCVWQDNNSCEKQCLSKGK